MFGYSQASAQNQDMEHDSDYDNPGSTTSPQSRSVSFNMHDISSNRFFQSTQSTSSIHTSALRTFAIPRSFGHSKNLGNLVSSRSWDLLRKKLNSRGAKNIVMNYEDSSGLSLLGKALGARSPIDIIEKIVLLHPEAIRKRDKFGALPIHTGCLNGISKDAIELMLKYDPDSLTAVDYDNRTLLHHAVERACVLRSQIDSSTILSLFFEHSIEAIELLLSVYPQSIRIQSKSGETPIDIPHIVKIKYGTGSDGIIDQVYELLKEMNIDLYEKEKLYWESNGYSNETCTGMDIDMSEHEEQKLNSSLPPFTQSSQPMPSNEIMKMYYELDQIIPFGDDDDHCLHSEDCDMRSQRSKK